MKFRNFRDRQKAYSVLLIVAHPDDETLWAGGTILSNTAWNWFIVSMCRAKDKDRAPRFYNALKILNSTGIMGNLDDGPEQKPLDEGEVKRAILDLIPSKHFDLIISHNPAGEYTKHIRHEEVGKAIIKLWYDGKISAKKLWIFAYEDGNSEYCPRPVGNASKYLKLKDPTWQRKYKIITETYGFEKNSWEAKTTTKAEAFWQFVHPDEADKWLNILKI
jgi:LmbE family N-acetylglucosaminyl deacetylase